MKSISKLLFLILAGGLQVVSGQTDYSYISDRKFKEITEMFGYVFKPNELLIKDEIQREIKAGSYTFGITLSNLYIDGEGIKGVYTINNIIPTEYGYQLQLMNARDPTLQGHLKVILNDVAQVDALIFKRSPKEKEMVFYQAAIPEALKTKETDYFTDKNELVIPAPDSLWTGLTIRPFFRMHSAEKVQERLQMNDSTTITFYEIVKVIDKSKKKNAKADTTVVAADSELLLPGTVPADTVENDKIKIIREHYIKIRSILEFEDGKKEDKTWEYQIERTAERENKDEGATDNRYTIFLKTTKGEELEIYLNNKRNVTMMLAGDKRYLMRGF